MRDSTRSCGGTTSSPPRRCRLPKRNCEKASRSSAADWRSPIRPSTRNYRVIGLWFAYGVFLAVCGLLLSRMEEEGLKSPIAVYGSPFTLFARRFGIAAVPAVWLVLGLLLASGRRGLGAIWLVFDSL